MLASPFLLHIQLLHPTVAFLRDALFFFIWFFLFDLYFFYQLVMRFSLFVLPFVAAVSALPLFQPAAHISAQCVDPLPLGKSADTSLRPTLRSLIHSHKIGVILRRIPELDVSEVIAEFNATSHGALPTLPPFAVPFIQRGYDILHGGAQFVGKHPIMADFAAKVAGFHWGSGNGDADLSIDSIGDYELPAWMMELVEELVELLEGHGDGKVRVFCVFCLDLTESLIQTCIAERPAGRRFHAIGRNSHNDWCSIGGRRYPYPHDQYQCTSHSKCRAPELTMRCRLRSSRARPHGSELQ